MILSLCPTLELPSEPSVAALVPSYEATPHVVLEAIERLDLNAELRHFALRPTRRPGKAGLAGWTFYVSAQSVVVRMTSRIVGRDFAVKVFLGDTAAVYAFEAAARLGEPAVQAHGWAAHLPRDRNHPQAVRTRDGVWLAAQVANWCSGQTLDRFIATCRRSILGRYRLVEAASVLRRLVTGMSRAGLAHGDLCARNVLATVKDGRFELDLIDTASLGWAGHTAGAAGRRRAGRIPARRAVRQPRIVRRRLAVN